MKRNIDKEHQIDLDLIGFEFTNRYQLATEITRLHIKYKYHLGLLGKVAPTISRDDTSYTFQLNEYRIELLSDRPEKGPKRIKDCWITTNSIHEICMKRLERLQR